jgi:hypothetical protein
LTVTCFPISDDPTNDLRAEPSLSEVISSSEV